MAEPKTKPQPRVAGKSKFRLPERQPRVSDINPLREILQEAKAQEEALAAPPPLAPARPTPAKKIAGVGRNYDTRLRDTPALNVAGVSASAGVETSARPAGDVSASFGDFSKRWSPILRSGQMSVCRVLFELTYGVGQAECFTSMPKLAAAAGIKERQCYNVVAQLEQLGFIARPEIFNTPTKKGTVFRLFLSPQEHAASGPNRHYHIGEGD
ncbi:MAG TPA: hypothetical protein VM864_16550 [Pyrinomonadaceae bacterium]|jgi:hypothetical protein|nr:hypothetical protein [Pyrinomonadaceae bacterium]